jgi:hypothetical protein
MFGSQILRPVPDVFWTPNEFEPLLTIDVSFEIVVVALFFVHFAVWALVYVVELSIVAEPSNPPSSPR